MKLLKRNFSGCLRWEGSLGTNTLTQQDLVGGQQFPSRYGSCLERILHSQHNASAGVNDIVGHPTLRLGANEQNTLATPGNNQIWGEMQFILS